MTIIEALKDSSFDARITGRNHRWMVWNDSLSEWNVYEKKPYQKNSRIVCGTKHEHEAVESLLKE